MKLPDINIDVLAVMFLGAIGVAALFQIIPAANAGLIGMIVTGLFALMNNREKTKTETISSAAQATDNNQPETLVATTETK